MTYEEKVAQLQNDLEQQIEFIKACELQGLCTIKEANKAREKVRHQFTNDLCETMNYAVLSSDPMMKENLYQGRIYG
jgi:hypothetical protein